MEKKEIGKLLELLNEYDPYIMGNGEKGDNFWFIVSRGGSAVFLKENGIQMIISKSYGFIQRLVEQDKINREEVDKNRNKDMSFVEFGLARVDEIKNKVVLMLLSISEQPIDLLISLLKDGK